MSDSERELNIQEYHINKRIFLVFVPIALMFLVIGLYQSNSLKYNEVKYLKSRNTEFSGAVIRKRQEGDYLRAGRFVLLDNYREERVDNVIYSKIRIGDLVYKKRGSDSIYFHLKTGEVIIKDYNAFLREKYFKLLSKE